MHAGSRRSKLVQVVIVPVAAAVAALALGLAIGSRYFEGNVMRAGTVAADMTSEEFDRRVRDFLMRNPEVMVESLRGLDSGDAGSSTGPATVRQYADSIFRDPASPVGGNPDGDVTIVEFFDYNCPYCRSMMPILAQALDADDGVRFVYKDWPILGPASEFAAKAALAAHKQGKYVAFHDTLMTGGAPATESRVLEVAEAVGLDLDRLKRDMEGDDIGQTITRTHELARVLGITGTPTFVIGDEVVRGAVGLRILQASISGARDATTAQP